MEIKKQLLEKEKNQWVIEDKGREYVNKVDKVSAVVCRVKVKNNE